MPSRTAEERLAATVVAQRPVDKGRMARKLLAKPLYRAGAMVAVGEADAMVAGVASPTRRVIEAAMMTIGLAPGIATPSSYFLMECPAAIGGPRTIVFADCAVNADPTSDQLADIAVASAESAAAILSEPPRIALLSFSTHGSAQHARVDKVTMALARYARLHPDLAIDGELQGDAALSKLVAAKKIPDLSTRRRPRERARLSGSQLGQHRLQAGAVSRRRDGNRTVPARLRQADVRSLARRKHR